MQDTITPTTRLLCPNGHGIQSAKKSKEEYTLLCLCARGNTLPKRDNQTEVTQELVLTGNVNATKDMQRIHKLGIQHLLGNEYTTAIKAVMYRSQE